MRLHLAALKPQHRQLSKLFYSMTTPSPPVDSLRDKFTDFTLAEVKKYNHNSHVYKFAFPDSTSIGGGAITHCIMVRAPEDGKVVDDSGKDVARPYTPVSSASTVGYLELIVKTYETGKISPFLASLKVGEKAAFKGPFAKFPYKASELEQGIAIAGGSGITPMYQLIAHALSAKDDTTKWVLVYSNVTEEDILLREEWDALAASNPDRLTVIYSLDKPPAGWTGLTGFISAATITEAAKALPPSAGEKVKFFICGPPGQVAAVAGAKDGGKQGAVGGALASLGYEAGQVFKF
ncbi:hypothetical protein BDY24DRAFT_385529 [Mrakia frigida]|uniref:cytochrome b5 reductase family protein n=1 Tax=Mrakia frigida TaxID=29902 RepID=UPI003FCC14C7